MRQSGSAAPRAHGGGRTPRLADADRASFEAYLAHDVSMTHAEMAARFAEASGRVVTRQTVQAYLLAWAITRKKKPSVPPSESGPT